MLTISGSNAMVNPYVQYHDVDQGTPEWFECRRGLITASGMKHLVTERTKKTARNDKASAYIDERAAERITGRIEEGYVSDHMYRGLADEVVALDIYAGIDPRVRRCGFVTNTRYGFTLGYSPDSIVGDVGLVEIKSQLPKYHVRTVVDGIIPSKHMAQVQSGLLAAEDRDWLDFISICEGMALFILRVYPDEEWQEAIVAASLAAETQIAAIVEIYNQRTAGAIIAPHVTTV